MKKLLGAAVVAGVLTLGAGAAYAGEVTGNGKSTPIRSGVARSICAYSGLQDDAEVGGPGSVQTPHGEPAFDLYFPPGVAGLACRGNGGGEP